MRIHGESLALLRVSAHDSYGQPCPNTVARSHSSNVCHRRNAIGQRANERNIERISDKIRASIRRRPYGVRSAVSTESRKKSFRAAIARFAFANRRMRRAGYAMWVMDATEKTMLHFGQVPPLPFFPSSHPYFSARAQAHSPLSLLLSRTLICIALGKLART